MGEKLLDNEISVDAVASKINKVVKEKFSIIDSDDNDLQKWMTVPKLLLLDEIAQKRFLSFIEYVDQSTLSIEKKVLIIISLSGLIDLNFIKLYDYDDGNLYLLADFYQDRTFERIKQSIPVIKRQELLLEVRKKTLDVDSRKKILSSIEKSLIDDKIDTANLNSVKEFVDKKIKDIRK